MSIKTVNVQLSDAKCVLLPEAKYVLLPDTKNRAGVFAIRTHLLIPHRLSDCCIPVITIGESSRPNILECPTSDVPCHFWHLYYDREHNSINGISKRTVGIPNSLTYYNKQLLSTYLTIHWHDLNI
jgi:hypothetical protein